MRTRLALTIVLSALVLGACARAEPLTVRLETGGAALSSAAAEKLAATTDIDALSSVPSTEAPALRDRMLDLLRAKGADGVRASELLTTGFPVKTASVPVLVRVCPVDGVDAIVVVEAFGDEGGTLIHRRLWVFDRTTGAILRAASFY